MGLELVEIVMELEDEFGIVLSDADVSEADTVGKTVDLVHARLRHSAEDTCPSQQGFYVVRQHLITQLGISRSAVRPYSKKEPVPSAPPLRAYVPPCLRAFR